MMAYTDQGYWASVGRSEFGMNFYNLDQPVFPGMAGDDVLLVQYLATLLFGWCVENNITPESLGLGSTDSYIWARNEFDGTYGPKTRRMILFLEKAVRLPQAGGFPVVPDGIVRPVPRGQKVSLQTGTMYKLDLFNNGARQFCDSFDPSQYADMPNHWETPSRLQVTLQQNVRE
jgi:peptidoglycan hydrolase-like protein with peptidoglycan-binding domain